MSAKTFFQPALLIAMAGVLLAGCHADPPVAISSFPQTVRTPVVDSARLQTITDSLAVLAAAPDTFRTSNKQVFRLQQIAKAAYDAASGSGPERSFPADSVAAGATEQAFIKTAGGQVWRAADTLFFRTNTGRIVRLRDGPTDQDAEDSYEAYRYLDKLAAMQQWLIEVGQWEGRHYLLIDQQTGQKTKLISYPVLSPDHARFACANSDPTGYSLDGLQLWQKPAGRPPRLLWQRLSNAAQPGLAALSPRWEGNNTLFFYQDFTSAGRYVRIILR